MKKAFTLVEMLIVIVIIGILAAALIPRLTGIQGRARDVARKADLQQISTSLSTYQLDNGSYPVGTPNQWTGAVPALEAKLVNEAKLMKSFPKESQGTKAGYGYWFSTGVIFLGSVSEGGGINANWSGSANDTLFPNAYSGIVANPASASSVTTLTRNDNLAEARYVLGQ